MGAELYLSNETSLDLPCEELVEQPNELFGRALRRQDSEPADVSKQDTMGWETLLVE